MSATSPAGDPGNVLVQPLPAGLAEAGMDVMRDVVSSGGAEVVPGLTLGHVPAGDDDEVVHGVLFDGAGSELGRFPYPARARGAALLVAFATALQRCWIELPQVAGTRYPQCSRHLHAATAREHEGAAWWVCPADGAALAPVGRLWDGLLDEAYSAVSPVLDAPRFPYGLPWEQSDPDELLFARDRVGTRSLIAAVSPVRAGGWWWSCMVYVRGATRFSGDADLGGRWPLDPRAPRPETAGFAHVSSAIPYRRRDGHGSALVRAGVAGRAVVTVEVVTADGRHELEVDPGSGAFAALALIGDDGRAELIARAADGTVLDTAVSEIGAADWAALEEDGVPRPLPEWMRPAVDAVFGDFRRCGGGPSDLTVGYMPNGGEAGAIVCLTYDGMYRWGFGVSGLARGAELTVWIADGLQDGYYELPGVSGRLLPPCPHHAGHQLTAEERDAAPRSGRRS